VHRHSWRARDRDNSWGEVQDDGGNGTTLYMGGNSTFFRLNVSVHFAVTSGRPGRPGGVQREEGVGGGADAVVGHCLQQAGGL